MSEQVSDTQTTRDDGNWARSVSKLGVSNVPKGAINLNVEGKQLAGALQGFGQLWQKTYRVRLDGAAVTDVEVMRVWKERFPEFQPEGNHFYPSMSGREPGEVIFIDNRLPAVPGLPGVIPFASGVMVMYVDDTCFTVMTPEGFPEAGWNTFSTYEKDGGIVAQVQSLARAADPIYEFGLRVMGGSRLQELTWIHVLTQLAAHYGVTATVEFEKVCVDSKLQWKYARNITQNAGVRTVFHRASAPLRRARQAFAQGADRGRTERNSPR